MKSMKGAFRTITVLVAISMLAAGDPPAGAQSQEQQDDATSVVPAAGVLQPQVVVDIGPSVQSQILKLGSASDSGAVVKKGDVLALLDPAHYQTEVAIAKTQVEQAEAEFLVAKAKVVLAARELEKTTKAHDKVADASDIAAAQAALALAKANVAQKEAQARYQRAALSRAEVNLQACTIHSPIDGVVIDRRINVGQIAPTSLFLIGSDLAKMDVWATVPEADVGRIAKCQAATFTVAAFSNRRFKAAVKQIRLNAAAQNNQVTYTVVLDCDNSDGRLLPYMSAKVAIAVGERR